MVRRVVEGRDVGETARSLAAEGGRAVKAILEANRIAREAIVRLGG